MVQLRLRRAAAIACAAAALAFGLTPSAAQAKWYRAETDRFVVYGEGREQLVREMTAKLMVFDAVLRSFYPSTRQRKPQTKVQVVVLASHADLRRVQPGVGTGVRGFYSATDEGVFAFVVNGDVSWVGADDVLFHEYGHHFLLDNFSMALPAWFVEGWAEYFATALVSSDGVRVGGYNEGRLRAIFAEPLLPLDVLLTKRVFELPENQRHTFYAQAWLLTHYMRSDPKRAAQMDAALAAISRGEAPVKAFEQATGAPLDQLAKAIQRYRKLWVYTIERDPKAPPPAMTVTVMPESADDLLLDRFRLVYTKPGSKDEGAFLDSIRRKAASHPADDLAETTLARAEYAIGDVAAGEAISRRRLQARPDDADELLLAGMGQMTAGHRDPTNRLSRFRRARPSLAKAYQLKQTDYRALYAYAMARGLEPGFPTENDTTALLLARDLAPAHRGIAFNTGSALVRMGRKAEAEQVLAPIINDPHGGAAAGRARAMLEGRPVSVDAADDDEPPKPPAKPGAK